ncbi:hypothetical protein PIB30_094510 [Stylosanthes scabra]|uniref:Uncharacterized protein n=1 Tax=Stylosanthes scabra TaxID=79078 RepID=A0ABU6QVM6_9FABA|nr:hypothetical protein [Stylosanthes scabra]
MSGSSLPDKIKDWVQQRPHEWWLVMSVLSGAVGLICFAVSFFNHHLKAWNLMLKLFISIACIALIFVAVLFAKNWLKGSIPWIKAHLVFSAIKATYIFTFLDKEQVEEEEADVYGLVRMELPKRNRRNCHRLKNNGADGTSKNRDVATDLPLRMAKLPEMWRRSSHGETGKLCQGGDGTPTEKEMEPKIHLKSLKQQDRSRIRENGGQNRKEKVEKH